MATPDRQERIDAATAAASVANDPFFGAKRKDVTVNGKTYKGAIDIVTARPPAALEVGMVSPISGLTISGTERNMTKERQALDQGYTLEYIESRGGINSQGYFNDTPLSGQLTAEEYKSVTKPDGTIDTQKMLAILNAKGGQSGSPVRGTGAGLGGTASSGGYNAQGIPTPGGAYNAQGQFVGSAANTAQETANRVSAYNLLYDQFNQYGLGALVEPLKNLILEGMPASEFTVRLRETDAYKKRFAANAQRIKNGLAALSEAQYIRTEDAYQDVMRRYGLPESYYSRGDMGVQEGFEKLIANDVSNTELEDRIATAQNRVINAAPEISASLRAYYPDITNGDILAYVLDPSKAIENIKRKVTAAEIGAAANIAGLNQITPESTPEQIAAFRQRAEELAKYGVTSAQAREGFQTVANVAPRGGQLAEIYKQSPYTQATAEQEVFGLGGATEAARQRKKLTQLEQASFAGQAGIAGGALARERAGSF